MGGAARRLVIGNWKMHGTRASLRNLELLQRAAVHADVDLMIAPPFTLLTDVARAASRMLVAGQDCHQKPFGAHTGSVSAAMLKEVGASAVILGHSERRRADQETDAVVAAKASSAITEELLPIICVGETWEQRSKGRHNAAIRKQLRASLPDAAGRCVIAYEPVWAIGSGRTPTNNEISEAITVIKDVLFSRGGTCLKWRIVYGGSVSAANASALATIEGLNGFLVGAASLRVSDFVPIIAAAGAPRDCIWGENARKFSKVGARG